VLKRQFQSSPRKNRLCKTFSNENNKINILKRRTVISKTSSQTLIFEEVIVEIIFMVSLRDRNQKGIHKKNMEITVQEELEGYGHLLYLDEHKIHRKMNKPLRCPFAV
jgi:hypothetical protein